MSRWRCWCCASTGWACPESGSPWGSGSRPAPFLLDRRWQAQFSQPGQPRLQSDVSAGPCAALHRRAAEGCGDLCARETYMTETVSAQDETIAAGSQSGPDHVPDPGPGAVADLRRTGINPDFWYPVAVSGSVRKNKTFAATFAGERIALYRGESGTVYALEDRCAHRQVPLSMGVVEGDTLRCCYHAWSYCGNGRISQIPYLPKGVSRPPRGVRAYPVREAYGLVFVFPGDPEKADTAAFPELPEFDSAKHKTMTFSRTVQCHYSFMHENLLDMNR